VELSLRTRVRAEDKEAFGLLFEEHAGAVYNHAFRLTGNWSTAEEVVSLTFLEAWRARGTIRAEGGSLLPWLLVIALNVTRNISRATRRQQAAMSRLPARADEPDFADELAGRIDDARAHGSGTGRPGPSPAGRAGRARLVRVVRPELCGGGGSAAGTGGHRTVAAVPGPAHGTCQQAASGSSRST
jgi:hypothetical protein